MIGLRKRWKAILSFWIQFMISINRHIDIHVIFAKLMWVLAVAIFRSLAKETKTERNSSLSAKYKANWFSIEFGRQNTMYFMPAHLYLVW